MLAERAENHGVKRPDLRVQLRFRITLVCVKVQPSVLEHAPTTRTVDRPWLAVGRSPLTTPLTTTHLVCQCIHEETSPVIYGRLGTLGFFRVQVVHGFCFRLRLCFCLRLRCFRLRLLTLHRRLMTLHRRLMTLHRRLHTLQNSTHTPV